MKTPLMIVAAVAALLLAPPPGQADGRELVPMPAPMAEHMLGNMRDHLAALEEILAALAAGDADAAGAVAESRLGMSSLDTHGAAHMAPLMPEDMRAIGTAMHRAASRFAIVAEDAEVTATPEAGRAVYGALRDITTQCNACHASYRIR